MSVVIATNLLPWEWGRRPLPALLSLLPFSGFLSGNMLVNAEALLEKVFLYGATIWLLMRGGMPLRWSSSLVVLALLLQELAQTQAVNGTAEITDPLLAVALGLLLAGTGSSRRPIGRSRRLSTGSFPLHHKCERAPSAMPVSAICLDSMA
ncbi:MAG: hypothetical protein MZV65_27950 [Chromatiales bacterium]|nr:hypothetical protein [Chromatiales bacterium]